VKILLSIVVLFCALSAARQVGAHPGMDATLNYLSAMIADKPNSQSLYHRRGIAYLHDGQYQKALSDLEKAAALGDPRRIDFHLGILYQHTKNYDAARTCLDSYLEYKPGHIDALRHRAKLRENTGDPAGALADYLAVTGRPRQANPADYLAAAGLTVGLPQYGINDAIAILDRGMEALGAIPQLQQRAMALEVSQGHYQRAISRLRSESPGAADNPFWRVEMGRLLLMAGESDQAYRHLIAAEQQLSNLRKTPARIQLSYELHALLAREAQ